jgi:hypothetical protein
MDPRRGNPWRNPVPRLLAEYVWAYVRMIKRSPLTPAERRECYRYLGEWMSRRAKPHRLVAAAQPVAEVAPPISVDELVAGRNESLS